MYEKVGVTKGIFLQPLSVSRRTKQAVGDWLRGWVSKTEAWSVYRVLLGWRGPLSPHHRPSLTAKHALFWYRTPVAFSHSFLVSNS